MTKKNMLNKRNGFTLVELIVVIAILGILAAIIIPRFSGFQEKAKATQALVSAKQVATAIDTLIIEEKDLAVAADTDNVRSLSQVLLADATITIDAPDVGDVGYELGYFELETVDGGYKAVRNTTTLGKVEMIP